MAETEVEPEDRDPAAAARRRRWVKALAVLAGLFVIVLAALWLSRERIAGNVIDGQLASLDLPATYEISRIGTDEQVLRNVVVGDPARPDARIAEVHVSISPGAGAPALGRVVLVRPRLYGSWRGGRLSFGSLDKVLSRGDPNAPFRLPDLTLDVRDGRALVETDQGSLGIRLAGSGRLRDGFAGELAVIAPQYRMGGCRIDRASLYGTLRVTAEKPRFMGPARMAALACANGLRAADAAIQLDSTFDRTLDGLDARLGLRSGPVSQDGSRIGATQGTAEFTWRKGALAARYDIAGVDLVTPQAALGALRIEGGLRGSERLARLDAEGSLSGLEIRPGGGLDAAFSRATMAGKGTMIAPIVEQVRNALRREQQGSRLSVSFAARRNGDLASLTLPRGEMRGGSGASLIAVSRVHLAMTKGEAPRFVGNFTTGGTNMPAATGRMERDPAGRLVMRLAMAEYRAGSARIALPRLSVAQTASGALGFAGEARITGDLPGGRAEGVILPIDGNWSQAGGLALWRRCTSIAFEHLRQASLALDRRSLTLCPAHGDAIVRRDARGLRLTAGIPALTLSGHLGGTPIRLSSGPVGVAFPGILSARSVDVALGPEAAASRFRISGLSARIGTDLAGTFSEGDVRLAAVPLDLVGASGNWRYAGGRLILGDGAFRLTDRERDARFRPLVAQAASLTLENGHILADAVLREPASQREIIHAVIAHDLANGAGTASLTVRGILFDDLLQPDTLTPIALGVIANTSGVVQGSGQIAWRDGHVTSSGAFGTQGLDFAAAFGPVTGASGTVAFTDLLGMVTAPHQKVRMASINPGIAIYDGEIDFALKPGLQLAIEGGHWPFLGGTLDMQPTTMNIGQAEIRRFAMVLDGVDSARLIQQMELGNIAVSGLFDGVVPLVFDENGGRIDNGQLQSRPPGGNVAYVGALTYKDLSPMANFAFDTLKSIDYRAMRVEMNGSLAGEILTRVQFDGIRQGTTAKRNFITRKISQLPIRFNVNIRGPFFQLATSLRSLYDPAYVRDPRSLGLMDGAGKPRKAADIQPPESGKMP